MNNKCNSPSWPEQTTHAIHRHAQDNKIHVKSFFQDYLLMDPSVRAIDGKKLVGDIKESIEQVLKKKVDAVKVRNI